MGSDFHDRCEAIEAGYEFALSYAAQGHSAEDSGTAGQPLREHLTRAAAALAGLEASCAEAVGQERIETAAPGPAARYEAFIAVLGADARHAGAAIELVLAQPAISSQLIDNLNASIHVRALLTDLFLFAEILEARQARALASG
ncbi:MAG: hypothetical protein ACRD1L_05030 [Terriglobales bacterium]